MSVKEYKKFIKKVYNHLFVEGSTTISDESTFEANANGNGEQPSKVEDIV